MKKLINLVLITTFFISVSCLKIHAIPSQSSVMNFDISVDKEKQSFTIFQVFNTKYHFYYVANNPSLATEGTGKNKLPLFRIIRYTSKNIKTKNDEKNAILDFSIELTPSKKAIKKMKAYIASNLELPISSIELSPLPFKSALATIYDIQGRIIASATQKKGIASSFSESRLHFFIAVKNLGNENYNALLKKEGLPIYITYTFDKIADQSNFKANVSWDKLYKNLNSNKKLQLAFSHWNYYRSHLGLKFPTDIEPIGLYLTNELISNGCISNISPNHKNLKPAELSQYLAPVLSDILKKLVKNVTPPNKINYRNSENSPCPVWGENTNITIEKKQAVKSSNDTILFSQPRSFESKITHGALFGIGKYSTAIQNRLIKEIPNKSWDTSFYTLPAVGDMQDLDISNLMLKVIPMYKDKMGRLNKLRGTSPQLAEWNSANQYFTDRKGNRINYLAFPLKAIASVLNKAEISLTSAGYLIQGCVIQGKKNRYRFQSHVNFFTNTVPISTPINHLIGCKINCNSGIIFGNRRTRKGLALIKMKIKVNNPKQKFHLQIKPTTKIKSPILLFEPSNSRKSNKITANIEYIELRGKRVSWIHSGKNLLEVFQEKPVILWGDNRN